MMKCSEAQEQFPMYWDMAEDEFLKRRIDEHLKSCKTCAEEFEFWRESTELIQAVPVVEEPERAAAPISRSVMDRIYRDEGWRVPLHTRTYRMSLAMRRNVSIAMAFFMGLFVLSFVYSIINSPQEAQIYSSLQAPATAVAAEASGQPREDGIQPVNFLLASISEPALIQVKSVQDAPNYYLVLSLLGITSILLTLNWLNRVRT